MKKPIVIIYVKGGVVQDVRANIAVRAIVYDWDCEDWDTKEKPLIEVRELSKSNFNRADMVRIAQCKD